MIIVEIQYRGTALLLLVNPCILHQNNSTVCLSRIYQLSTEKKMLHCQQCSTRYTAVQINYCLTLKSKLTDISAATHTRKQSTVNFQVFILWLCNQHYYTRDAIGIKIT